MRATILSHSASSPTTKNSLARDQYIGDQRRVTRTNLSHLVVMVEVHPAITPPINDESSLDDLIAEFSVNPEFNAAFERANADIAQRYYADEGVTIRTLRLKAGLTQGQLAEAIESVQSHVSRIEAGSQDVYTETVDKLARAFGASSAVVLDAVRNTRGVLMQKVKNE